MAPHTTNGSTRTSSYASPESNALSTSAATSNDGDVASFWNRYERLKYGDIMKDALIEDVLNRYEYLMHKHQQYVEEHKAEREYMQNALQRDQKLQTELLHLQRLLNRDPYILVLIDGDGMIFNDKLLLLGEDGGKRAANLLHTAIHAWALENVADCPRDVKIVVRAYANLEGLAEVCTKAGLVPSPDRLVDFVCGFTRGKPLFDFTDVGMGKHRADGKLNESFKLFIYDYHCRQVLFGCSHDNGYARLLEQYIDDVEVKPRLTMLEGVPFEKELIGLPFPKAKFKDIFRESKICVPGQVDLLTGGTRRVDSRGLNAASRPFTPQIATPGTPYSPIRDIPNLDGQPMSMRPLHIRGDSLTSSPGSCDAAQTTWASMAVRNAHKPLIDIPRTPAEPTDPIKRNKWSQRVDEELQYDRDEVQRIKKLKSCNQHYIGVGCCHFNAGRAEKCPHTHTYIFSESEKKTLRVVARETPCKTGHDCDNPKCIYGHQCPFPITSEGTMRGIGCLNGESCRFPRSMHGMDKEVVKTIRVTGAF